MKKEDRRVRFTKMFLKESLVNLLENKPLSKITVKEICENADINRATFYAHFRDQYDLLENIKEEYIENILKNVNYNLDSSAKSKDNLVPLITEILIFIKDNAKLGRLLLSDRGDIGFQKRIMALAHEGVLIQALQIESLEQEKVQYVSSYLVAGCVGVIQKWFDNDLKSSPLEVASLIGDLTQATMKLMA